MRTLSVTKSTYRAVGRPGKSVFRASLGCWRRYWWLQTQAFAVTNTLVR